MCDKCEENNPCMDCACKEAAAEDGHDQFAAIECLEGGQCLNCSGCPFE